MIFLNSPYTSKEKIGSHYRDYVSISELFERYKRYLLSAVIYREETFLRHIYERILKFEVTKRTETDTE